MKILKVQSKGPNPFIEDPKYPHKLIKEIKRDESRKDFWWITILHPNKVHLVDELMVELEKLDIYDRSLYELILNTKSLVKIEGIPQHVKDEFDNKDKMFKDPEDVKNPVLYNQRHKCQDFQEALDKADEMALSFANVETYHENILYKSHWKRGKKTLREKPKDDKEFTTDAPKSSESKAVSDKTVNKDIKKTAKKVSKKVAKKTTKKTAKKVSKKVAKKTTKKKNNKK